MPESKEIKLAILRQLAEQTYGQDSENVHGLVEPISAEVADEALQ